MTESTPPPRETWSEVGRQFEELGRVLRGHFGAHPESEAESEAEAEAGAESAGSGDRAAVRGALRRIGQAAQQLGDHAGEAVHDPEVRASAQRAARTLADALDATFSELGEELRGRMRTHRGSGPADQEPGSGQPPASKEIGGTPGPEQPS